MADSARERKKNTRKEKIKVERKFNTFLSKRQERRRKKEKNQ